MDTIPPVRTLWKESKAKLEILESLPNMDYLCQTTPNYVRASARACNELDTSELDEENVLEIEDVVFVCAGLVTLDKESDIIRQVHYTTQEYYERTQVGWFPDAQKHI